VYSGLQNTLEKMKFFNMLSQLNYIYGTISFRCCMGNFGNWLYTKGPFGAPKSFRFLQSAETEMVLE
jgi:hypothetical protein